MEKACDYDTAAMQLLQDESISDISKHGLAEGVDIDEVSAEISKEISGKRLQPRLGFSKRVWSSRCTWSLPVHRTAMCVSHTDCSFIGDSSASTM